LTLYKAALWAVVLRVACALKRRHSRWFRMAECRLSQIAQWIRRLWTVLQSHYEESIKNQLY